jgi:hypothetical protein
MLTILPGKNDPYGVVKIIKEIEMKRKLFGILAVPAVLLALGLVLAGCDNGSTGSTSSSGGPGGGAVPSELLGRWGVGTTELLNFTSAGKCTFGYVEYDVSVSGTTVTLSYSGNRQGTFSYSVTGNQLTVSNGTGPLALLTGQTLTKM